MSIYIVDTTLRDGEQKAGIALNLKKKIKIARILNEIGIYQIEGGIPAMGGEELKSVHKMAELGLKSKISAWNRLKRSDIVASMECGVDIVHISVPSSDILIESKLQKNREWIIDNLRRCIDFCNEKAFTVTLGLEDASRADQNFLLRIIATAFSEGVQQVRYADTVGVLSRRKVYDDITAIKAVLEIDIEMHAHNDLGMAVSNSISAVKAGSKFIDCTIGGIGERAGNCNLLEFIKAGKVCLSICTDFDLKQVKEAQEAIMGIIT